MNRFTVIVRHIKFATLSIVCYQSDFDSATGKGITYFAFTRNDSKTIILGLSCVIVNPMFRIWLFFPHFQFDDLKIPFIHFSEHLDWNYFKLHNCKKFLKKFLLFRICLIVLINFKYKLY